MIDYRFQGRLTYINGGGLNVQMSAWPAAGGNWWEPTTGSFTCVAAYQAKGAASLAASYVNLANPGTYDLTLGDAPTFDAATGWTFNGTSDYLKTGIVPAGAYSIAARFSNASGSNGWTVGTFNASDSKSFGLYPRQGGAARNYFNVGDRWISGGALTAGVMGFANKAAYLNGSSDGTIGAGTSTFDADLYIGARNNDGFGVVFFYTGNILAVAIYSTTLDATQMAEVSANMAAL